MVSTPELPLQAASYPQPQDRSAWRWSPLPYIMRCRWVLRRSQTTAMALIEASCTSGTSKISKSRTLHDHQGHNVLRRGARTPIPSRPSPPASSDPSMTMEIVGDDLFVRGLPNVQGFAGGGEDNDGPCSSSSTSQAAQPGRWSWRSLFASAWPLTTEFANIFRRFLGFLGEREGEWKRFGESSELQTGGKVAERAYLIYTRRGIGI